MEASRDSNLGSGPNRAPSPERMGGAGPRDWLLGRLFLESLGQAAGPSQLEDMGGRTEASPGRVATSTWQTLPGLPCACSKGHISHGPLSLRPREPRTHTRTGTLRVHYGIHKWFTVGTWGPWQLDPRDGCDPRLGESPGSIPGVCVPTVAASGPSCADPSVDRPLADGSRLSDGVPGVDPLG